MPKPPLQLQGQLFGQLTVTERDASNSHYWFAACSCGEQFRARGSRLKDGTTSMCGACRRQSSIRHGHSRRASESLTYTSWRSMKQRCGNPSVPSHAQIFYPPEWEVFENFLRDMGERPAGKTLDRINVFRGYEKSNCRWATPETQSNNRRHTVQLVYKPYSLYVIASISEWARFLRDLTGNQKWSTKALRAIIDSGTMDIDHIVMGISPELRAHHRLAMQKEQEQQEQLAEIQQLFDELLAQSAGIEEPLIGA